MHPDSSSVYRAQYAAPMRIHWLLWPCCACAAVGCAATPSRVSISAVDLLAGGFSVGKAPEEFGHTSSERVELRAARGETTFFTFDVSTQHAAVPNVTVTATPFSAPSGTLAPSAVVLYRVQEVSLPPLPGWHIRSVSPEERIEKRWDVLVPVTAPRGGVPLTLRPGQKELFWADIAVPRNTPAGLYAGEITVLSSGEPIASLPVVLEVFAFLLPWERTLPLIGVVDHQSLFAHHFGGGPRPEADFDGQPPSLYADEFRELLRTTMTLLDHHGVYPVVPRLAPSCRFGASGRLELDWAEYDQLVASWMDGMEPDSRRIPYVWPIPLQPIEDQLVPRQFASPVRDTSTVKSYLSECVKHFRDRDWLDWSYALLDDANDYSVAYQMLKRYVAYAEEAAKEVRIVSSLFPQDMKPFGWSKHVGDAGALGVHTWATRAQFFDEHAMLAETKSGRSAWLSVDRPPFSGTVSVFGTPCDVRVLPSQARRLGASAIYLGPVASWSIPPNNSSPSDFVRADPTVLLYPGTVFGLNSPVPSVRLKLLRRAVQDDAYVALAKQVDLGHIAEVLDRSLAQYAGTGAYEAHFADGRVKGWSDDWKAYETAKDLIAMAVTEELAGTNPRRHSVPFETTAAWRSFMEATRDVELQAGGCRIHSYDAGTLLPMVEVQCVLSIHNGMRTPLQGVLSLRLDEPWMSTDLSSREVAVPPESFRQVSLIALCSRAALSAGGISEILVTLANDEGAPVAECRARVGACVAVTTQSAIHVDGELSDWPAGSGNVAGDFRLICPNRESSQGGARRWPRERTVCFVLRDKDALYVAINCEGGPPVSGESARRKQIIYEDLVPLGEELVEILLDPLNAGTRSPADLYHIVVKQNGFDITQKGVSLEPPVGDCQSWSADTDMVVRLDPGRWTAELRVPLSAFPDVDTAHAWWGFNVTRYDVEHQEFSTWSGAVGNAYDPLALGNLYLP